MGVTGILPAAGLSTRLDGLPKFLLPCPEGHLLGNHIARMRSAGADEIWVGASKLTAPMIKPYLDNRATLKPNLETASMCETVCAARAYAADNTVLMGLPDTYWKAPDVYGLLLYRIREFGADVAIAAWKMRNEQRGKLGAVDQRAGRLSRVVEKDANCDLDWAWGALAWTPKFWECISPDHAHLGLSLQNAVSTHLNVLVVQIQGDFWDCGTRDEYFQLCGTFAYEAQYA